MQATQPTTIRTNPLLPQATSPEAQARHQLALYGAPQALTWRAIDQRTVEAPPPCFGATIRSISINSAIGAKRFTHIISQFPNLQEIKLGPNALKSLREPEIVDTTSEAEVVTKFLMSIAHASGPDTFSFAQ